jgi:putative pre-16S rRNA nuclease
VKVILGIDYGSKRVGLALGNDQARLASPQAVLANDEGLWKSLKQLIEAENVTEIVLGLPRGLDGQETTQTATTRAFAAKLAKYTGLKINLQDEAATTVTAKASNRGATPDSAAAAIILQDYLDNL